MACPNLVFRFPRKNRAKIRLWPLTGASSTSRVDTAWVLKLRNCRYLQGFRVVTETKNELLTVPRPVGRSFQMLAQTLQNLCLYLCATLPFCWSAECRQGQRAQVRGQQQLRGWLLETPWAVLFWCSAVKRASTFQPWAASSLVPARSAHGVALMKLIGSRSVTIGGLMADTHLSTRQQ